ncbi:MAG: SWF/SNF helicase family protein, partial [Victivallales bacterium]|nr:SWF/SNF helicase family protein [Victivallales bacterium]
FSQFTQMLDIIQRRLDEKKFPSRMIIGETKVEERARLVEEFNADERPSVMLLSLKAASTGLTLTKADYVFLYDPWWNPAVENQAIDRTHRIGQTKPVFAYRMVAQNSIEERVIALMQEKQELFDTVVGGANEANILTRLGRAELLQLLE